MQAIPHPLPGARVAALLGLLASFALLLPLTSCAENGPGPTILEVAFAPPDPGRYAYVTNAGDDTISSYLVTGLGRLNASSYFAFDALETQPTKIIEHPDREFFFTANEASSTVNVLGVDQESGRLSIVGVTTGLGLGALDIGITRTGEFFYSLSQTSRQLTQMSFDAETGQLTQFAITTTANQQTPTFLVIDPRGRYLATLDASAGSIQTFQINTDGQLVAGSLLNLAPNLIGGAVIDIGGNNLYVSVPNQDFVIRVSIDPTVTEFTMTLEESIPTDSDLDELAQPGPLTIHPSGRFLYVLNQGAENIFYYSLSNETFELEAIGALPSVPDALDLVFEPAGDTGYLIDPTNNRLIRYSWDFEDGLLQQRQEIRTRANPSSMAFLQAPVRGVPVPETLYVSNERSSDVTLFVVEPNTGVLSPLGAPVVSGTGPLGLALDREQRFLFVANGTSQDLSVFTVEADGTLTPFGDPLPMPGTPTAVATEPQGQFLYVALRDPDLVTSFRIFDDQELQPIGEDMALGVDPTAIMSDPTGQRLYVANSALSEPGSPSSISIFSISARSGTLTPVNPSGAVGGGAVSIEFSPDGARLYTTLFAAGTALPFDVSSTLGTLAPVAPPTPTGPGSVDIDITSTGRYAYVAVRDESPDGVVQLFDVLADGMLVDESNEDSQTPRQVVTAGMAPVALLTDLGEDFLWVVADDSGSVVAFQVAPDGLLTEIQEIDSGLSPTALVLRSRID